MVVLCNNCGEKIEEGEIIYLLVQGRFSDHCFVQQPYPLNLIICKSCAGKTNHSGVG